MKKLTDLLLIFVNICQVFTNDVPPTATKEVPAIEFGTGTLLEEGKYVTITFPDKRIENLKQNPVDIEIPAPDGSTYKIRCERYKKTTVDIFALNGARIESVLLLDTEPNPCDESYLKKVITPTQVGSKIKMIYLWENKNCKMVEYNILTGTELMKKLNIISKEEDLLHAGVESTKAVDTECAGDVSQFLSENGQVKIGVASLASEGQFIYDTDYMYDREKWEENGEPHILDFPEEEKFYLVCEGYKKKGRIGIDLPPVGYPDVTGVKNRDVYKRIGSIVYNDTRDVHHVLLERFYSDDHCHPININVNEKIIDQRTTHITILFKALNRKCYRREYKIDIEKKTFFDKITVNRDKLQRVIPCPEKYTGEIGGPGLRGFHPMRASKVTLLTMYEIVKIIFKPVIIVASPIVELFEMLAYELGLVK